MIQRAMFDWVIYRDSNKLEDKKKAESAHTWLFEPSVLCNGLENVCSFVGIDADQVRERAKRMERKDVVKMEHLERGPALQPMTMKFSEGQERSTYSGKRSAPTAYPKGPGRADIPEGLHIVDEAEEDEDEDF